MTLDEYRARHEAEDDWAPGWEAIDARLEAVYPGVEPAHFGAVPHYAVGGSDPIDGLSRYECADPAGGHQHFVTYGFSQLYYDEDDFGGEYSNAGFELTFRLRPYADEEGPPGWVWNFLNNLARYVFKTGNVFDDGHWMTALGPIRADTDTQITGIVFVTDPMLGVIATPHGEVKFLQVVGITTAELEAVKADGGKVAEIVDRLRAADPLLVTDLLRTS